jgi:hypothetical protein
MKLSRATAVLIAIVSMVVLELGMTGSAYANVDFDKYCKTVYGPQSRAVMLNERDPNSWRCTKGAEQVSINMEDLCHRLSGPTYTALANNPSDAKSWTCVPHDRAITGTVPPERVINEEEDAAKKLRAEGKTSAFGRKFYFFMAGNATEFAALAKNVVFLIVVWMPKPEDLPIKRVYIRANNNDTVVKKVSSWRTEVDSKMLTAQVFGSHREDGFYLVPTGALLRDGQIWMDFSGSRPASLMLGLPSNVVVDAANKNPMYKNPDAAPNAKPDLRTLQDFIRRKFPGFPVPTSIP